MGIVPALALLLPFFAIMCFILLLFGIDTSKDIENYMIFTGWMAIIFTIVVVAITQWMTLLFKSMDKSLSLFKQSKDTRNTDEILDCLYHIHRRQTWGGWGGRDPSPQILKLLEFFFILVGKVAGLEPRTPPPGGGGGSWVWRRKIYRVRRRRRRKKFLSLAKT